MEPFTKHASKAAILDWSDVNTDLIIPARYLKRVERTGYGPLLFADKRYVPGGAPSPEDPTQHGDPDPEFPLNAEATRGATILLVGKNFGCGSSREHAVWAVAQAGYRAVIAPGKDEGFADIFEGNAFNNGLLPIELKDDDWASLAELVRRDRIVEIDLESKRIACDGRSFGFDVPEENRQRLLRGLDFIAETLLEDAAIGRYEFTAPAWAGTRGGSA